MGDIAGKFLSTIITVVIAVAVSGGIWVGANLLFNQVRTAYVRYRALAWGACGFGVGVLFSGNQVTAGSTSSGGGFSSFGAWVWLPLLAAVISGVVGASLAIVAAPPIRLAIGIAGLGGTGALLGALVTSQWRPQIAPVALVVAGVITSGATSSFTSTVKVSVTVRP